MFSVPKGFEHKHKIDITQSEQNHKTSGVFTKASTNHIILGDGKKIKK